MKIGLVIKALRAEKNWSQEALALEVDTATSNLSRIEKGLRTPSLDLLFRLAKALNVEVSELFRAAEGGDMPVLKKKKKNKLLEEQNSGHAPDYAEDAVQIRRLFRELNPQSRSIAVELLKALKIAEKQ